MQVRAWPHRLVVPRLPQLQVVGQSHARYRRWPVLMTSGHPDALRYVVLPERRLTPCLCHDDADSCFFLLTLLCLRRIIRRSEGGGKDATLKGE